MAIASSRSCADTAAGRAKAEAPGAGKAEGPGAGKAEGPGAGKAEGSADPNERELRAWWPERRGGTQPRASRSRMASLMRRSSSTWAELRWSNSWRRTFAVLTAKGLHALASAAP